LGFGPTKPEWGKRYRWIELLMIAAIFGLLISIVALNIAGFVGTGTEEIKAMELQNVRTAVVVLLLANWEETPDFAGGTLKAGDDGTNITCGTDNLASYLTRPVEYSYSIAADGTVTRSE